jgi:hypothetical protein
MGGDGGVDQVAAQRPEPRECSLLVDAGQPAVADDIGDQNRRELPGLAHCGPLAVARLARMPTPVCLFCTGRTAHVRIPSVPGINREGQLRVRQRT